MSALSDLKATHQSCDADSKPIIFNKPKMPKYGGGGELNVMVAGVIKVPAQIKSSFGSNPTGNSSTGVAKFPKPITEIVTPDVVNKDENTIQVDAAMANTADLTPRKTTKLSIPVAFQMDTQPDKPKLLVKPHNNVQMSLGNRNNADHKPVQKPESLKHSDNMSSVKTISFDPSRKGMPGPIKAPTDNFIIQKQALKPMKPYSSHAIIRSSDDVTFLKVNFADFSNCEEAPEKPSQLNEEIDVDLLIKEFKEAVLNTVLLQEDDYDDIENAIKNAEAEDRELCEPSPEDDDGSLPHMGPKLPELAPIRLNKIQTESADCVPPEPSPTTPTAPTTPKEKPKDSKEAYKERKRNKKEEKEMKKKEKEIKILCEWYKIDSAGLAMSVAKGTVKKTAKSKNKKEVSVNKGDEVNIIRMVDCPTGKWLVQIVSSQNVGYCDDDNIEIDAETIRTAMASSGSSSGMPGSTDTAASQPSDWPQEAYEDVDENKDLEIEDEIYEECS